VRSSRWQAFRDPSQTWQRPFVGLTNQEQQALDRLVPVMAQYGTATMTPSWTKEILGRAYAAWPFVEYGLFLSLAFAIREAMADTVNFSLVFQSYDRLRALQDIVQHLDVLSETSAFSDEGAREAWMTDPTLVGIRDVIERISASHDWVEVTFVIGLVFDPLVGHLAKAELFAGRAALAGDAISPLVMAGAIRDNVRHVSTTQALVKTVCADPETGAANAEIFRRWNAEWQPLCEAAARSFLPTFTAVGISEQDAEQSLQRALDHQKKAFDGTGVSA
jgi:methane monooxygenase component A beta chain/propane monooxygenase small subunit